MKSIKIILLNLTLVITLSGCVAELMLAGTVVSVAATAQEVEEDHKGNIWDYIVDKYDSLKSYVERKVAQSTKN